MPAVASYASSDDGPGNEDIYSPGAEWHPLETLFRGSWMTRSMLTTLTSDAEKRPVLLQMPQQVWACSKPS